jgi:hypothetical protein
MKNLVLALTLLGGCKVYDPHERVVVDYSAIIGSEVDTTDHGRVPVWGLIDEGVVKWREQMGVEIYTIRETGGDLEGMQVIAVEPQHETRHAIATYYPDTGHVRVWTGYDYLSTTAYVHATAHELGHAFGLEHEPECAGIMASVYGEACPHDFTQADRDQFATRWY